LVRELQCGDVVLMVLIARKEKGWNFGSTRIRMAAESEITVRCSGLRVRERRRVDQEGAMRHGGAVGA
jgi:hypothetical protein